MPIAMIVIVFLAGAGAAGIYGPGSVLFLGLSILLVVAWLDLLDARFQRMQPVSVS